MFFPDALVTLAAAQALTNAKQELEKKHMNLIPECICGWKCTTGDFIPCDNVKTGPYYCPKCARKLLEVGALSRGNIQEKRETQDGKIMELEYMSQRELDRARDQMKELDKQKLKTQEGKFMEIENNQHLRGQFPSFGQAVLQNAGAGLSQPRGIQEALATHEREVENLGRLLSALVDRLEPVLRPVPPRTSDKKPEKDGGCAIAQAMFKTADEINAACQVVENLLSRLEL